MSTALVTFFVLALAIGTVLAIALADPNQPATMRLAAGRDRRRNRGAAGFQPGAPPATPAAGPERSLSHEIAHSWVMVRLPGWRTRAASGVALTVMVLVTGAVVAAALAATALLVSFGVQRLLG